MSSKLALIVVRLRGALDPLKLEAQSSVFAALVLELELKNLVVASLKLKLDGSGQVHLLLGANHVAEFCGHRVELVDSTLKLDD